jgi:5-methylcytosine-specific restriction endonuclease McrA
MPEATRPAFINCAHCGVEKRLGQRGPVPIYCSAICRRSAQHQRSKQDGRYEQEFAALRRRTAERQAANAQHCPYCGDPMTNVRRKQCGKPECKRAFNAERMRKWQRDYQAEHGQWYRQANYADQQCEYSRRRREELGHWRVHYPAAAAAGDARRRMRMEQARQAEAVVPAEVHARDGWTCRLCGLPIDPEVAWPDPMSASVDHIVPLSRGGLHSMINVQSAHLGCNSSKRDRVIISAES